MCISDKRIECSNFGSLIPMTTDLDNLTVFISSSILGNKLLTLKWIKRSPLDLKTFAFTFDHYAVTLSLNLYYQRVATLFSNKN